MPNVLDANGLQVSTRSELVAFYTTQFQSIYGADVNLASNTPDGQLLNIFVQSVLDLQDLLVQIYNQFDPDNAIGVVLDQRVAINGIQRQGGTFTVTPVTLTISSSVNLYGLDQTAQPIYTVADNAGNNWFLQTTVLGLGVGAHILNFRAAVPGAQLTVPNTINVPVTVVLGVASINNPTTYTTLGEDEESDAILRVRRQQSVSKVSQGYLASLLAELENINGVTSAFVYENLTDTVNSDGVPGHSIWVIVAGSGAASAIANAIYTKRNAGCGMFGDTTYTITQVDGTMFIVQWDDVVAQTVFIAFSVTSLNGTVPPNIAAIRSGLPTSYVLGVNGEANINQLATQVQLLDGNTLVTGAGFSTGETQIAALSGVAASGTLKLNYNGNETAAINWNDSTPAIQTKLRAVPGLATVTVSGTIAGQSLHFNLANEGGVEALLYATANSLLTSGAVAITFAWNEGYTNTLLPSSKKNQFVVAAADIVILAMQLTPPTATLVHGTSQQFTGLGGYGPYVYSFQTNNSGGTINAGTGAYTAGVTPGTDTLKVVDAFGNSATAVVTVT